MIGIVNKNPESVNMLEKNDITQYEISADEIPNLILMNLMWQGNYRSGR